MRSAPFRDETLGLASRFSRRVSSGSPNRLLRYTARVAYYIVGIAFSIGFVSVTYLSLGPAWVRGELARVWDSVSGAGVRDVVSGHGRARRVQFADGSSVVLEEMSWVRYPAAFDAAERAVYLEGEGRFAVRRGAEPFVIRADAVTIRTDSAELRIWGAPTNSACAIQVIAGRVSLSWAARRDEIIDAPQTWVRGGRCASYGLTHSQSVDDTRTSTVRK